MANTRSDRVKPLCLAAIKTMRDFLDDAERNVIRDGAAPEEMVERTLHKLSWGFANASSSLCSALGAIKDARTLLELRAKESD